jgi:hypothetical protein
MLKFLLLLVIMAYAIFRMIVSIITTRRQCLDDKTLRDYLTGSMGAGSEERRRVIRHLGSCEKCQKRMTEFDFKAYAKKMVEEED